MAGLAPIALAPKEGLALINGTQVSTALALDGLFAIEDAFAAALVAGVMSVDAVKGSDAPFDARIHALRGQPGQIEVAAAMRAPDRRQRHPRLACRLRQGAGPLFAALPAAGDGRGARPDAPCGARRS